MATEILPTGSTGASSGDVSIEAGTLVALKDEVNRASVAIEVKNDEGGYEKIGSLTSPQAKSAVINGDGTYRFTRVAGFTCGVFSA